MHGENFIMKAWDNEERKFLLVLSVVRNAPTKDAVHDLRVSIKRLRSYLTLNSEYNGKDFRDVFAPLRKLFRISGKYRDLQMTLGMSRKQNLHFPNFSKAFELHCGSMLGTTQNWTQFAAKGFETRELQLMRDLLQDNLGKESNPSLRELVKEKIHSRLKEMRMMSEDLKKNAHEIRKKGKLVGYWLEIIPPPPLFEQKEKEQLEKALDLLGKRQDHMILQQNLKQFTRRWVVKDLVIHDEAKKIIRKVVEDDHQLLAEFEKINLPRVS